MKKNDIVVGNKHKDFGTQRRKRQADNWSKNMQFYRFKVKRCENKHQPVKLKKLNKRIRTQTDRDSTNKNQETAKIKSS